MSKKARLKEKAEKQRERNLEHAYKNSPGYLKGPKAPGPNSPVFVSRFDDYKPNTQPDYGAPRSHFDVRPDKSGVVSQPPRSFGYSPAEPMARGSFLRGLDPIYSAPPSLEARVDISSLPPLPADGGVELLFVDADRFIIIGGIGIEDVTERILAVSRTAWMKENYEGILDRHYSFGEGLENNTFVRDLLGVPNHRVHRSAQLDSGRVRMDDFGISASDSQFERAERYVAQALKAAAQIDRASGSAAPSPTASSPDAPYVPLAADPSGVYCVLHDRESDFAYVLLDARSLPQSELGYGPAAQNFFERSGLQFDTSQIVSGFSRLALPFALFDAYNLSAESNRPEAIQRAIQRVLGVSPNRVLSFPYEVSATWRFNDLRDQPTHTGFKDLVIKYTNRARETGNTIFEF